MNPVQSAPTLGDLLRRYRLAAGLSQEALAERATMSVEAISALERGVRQVPRPETVMLLADALRLSPQERAMFGAAIPQKRRGRDALPLTSADRSRASPARPTHVSPALALSAPLTALIGREHEVAAIMALLGRDDVRLLTLVGPPGVGKTRLALAAAEIADDAFPNGAAVVSLGDIRSAGLVAPTLARALGVDQGGELSPLGAIIAHLRDRRALLVLDNFEQVAAAAPLVVDLCAACPGVVALVTSRTALYVRGEQTFPLLPLALPPLAPAAPPDADGLSRYAAVRLFVRRVQDVRPDFALTPANAAVVAALCRRLDGLPLAIELAAARARTLPLATLLAQLERRQDVLANGPCDLPARQRALRDALDWSYDLLDPLAQATFRRLAVFAGDFSTGAAVALCAVVDDAPVPSPETIAAAIEVLVNGSLLSLIEPDGADADAEGEPLSRLRMLTTVRAYALDRLRTSGEEARLRRMHADHYLTVAEEAAGALVGPNQAHWVAQVAREYDGLRATLQWAWEVQDVGRGLRLAGALWYFWYVRGYLTEGRAWLERALTAAATDTLAAPADAHARACDGAAILAYEQNDHARAATLFARALALYAEAGDQGGRAAVLGRMGLLALAQGDYARAETLAGESLTLRRGTGDRWGAANALSTLGTVARLHGTYGRARELFHESLVLKHDLGDTWGIAYALNNLGVVARDQGRVEEARVLHEEALALFRQVRGTPGVADALANLATVARDRGDDAQATELAGESLRVRRDMGGQRGSAATLRTLADVARDQGDTERAAALYTEGLDLLRDSGDHAGLAACLEGLAATAWTQGQAERTAQLYGRAEAVRAEHNTPLPPVERLHQDEVLAALRAALDDDDCRASWEDGRATPLDDIISTTIADVS